MTGTARTMMHLKRVDPTLWKAFMTLERAEFVRVDERLGRTPNPKQFFADICETIIGQQLSGKAAATIHGRFVGLCPKVTPERVSGLSLDALRSVGISYAKGRALLDLAEKVQTKALVLKNLDTVLDEELRKRLIAVKGIGPWTAEMILMFTLYRPDVFSPGDLGLQKGVQIAYRLPKLPTPEYVLKKSVAWSPYRTYVSMLLWRLVDSKKEKKVAGGIEVRRKSVS